MISWLENSIDKDQFGCDVLAWYDVHKRNFSWRDSDNPYHIWVSEVMLQQTRVEQMDAYFTRFITRFPTVDDLANAKEEEVLKVWEGLGYYARARNMASAARHIVSNFDGILPDSYDELLELPGIGSYTAAAIASIAFGHHFPVMDGNVIRVLSRLFRIEEDPKRSAVKSRMLEIANTLLVRDRAGDFNQAMMELGSRICKHKKPKCTICPIVNRCRSYIELDDPTILPMKAKRKRKPHYQVAAGLIWRGQQLLIAKRPNEGMLAGLWEFPGGKQESGETLEECLVREIREELDFEIEVDRLLHSVDHIYSHFSITLHAFCARYVTGNPRAIGCADWCWISPKQLDNYPFPRSDLKIIEYLRKEAYLLPIRSECDNEG